MNNEDIKKIPEEETIEEFKNKVQSLVPAYIIVGAYVSNSKESITVLFRYVDGATVTEIVELKEEPSFDIDLAKDVVVRMIDKSLRNLEYHSERLKGLKESVLKKYVNEVDQ